MCGYLWQSEVFRQHVNLDNFCAGQQTQQSCDSSWSKRRQVITATGQNGDKKAKSKMTRVKSACQNGDKNNYESV